MIGGSSACVLLIIWNAIGACSLSIKGLVPKINWLGKGNFLID